MAEFAIGKEVGESDILGENNQLRRLCNTMVENVVKQGKWFTICHKIHKDQVDIMKISNKEDVTLGAMVSDAYPEMEYRPAIYKYLLKNYLCYLETPIVTKDVNSSTGWKNAFNKALVTANIGVVAKWAGMEDDEADVEYGGKLQFYDEDDTFLVPYYKLTINKEGIMKVSKPRKDLDLSAQGTRVVPLFMLKRGVDTLYNMLKEDTYNITFSKDNSQLREINTTFNVDKIKEVYGDTDFVRSGIDSWYDGSFLFNPNLERGYIRVFEMGGSIYDSPTRSVNYARIVKFSQEEPDLSYMNIDLDSVLDQFINYCHTVPSINKEIDSVVESLDLFNVGSSRVVNNNKISNVNQLVTWAEGQKVLLSTMFLRNLALFMVGNPQWFEGYTGEPTVYSATDTADWGDDDLDIG